MPEIKKDYNQKNNTNQQDTHVVGTPDENAETGRDTVLRRYHKLSQKKGEHDQKRLKDNASTIIVIAYTVLILVLGFLVYRDISKRLNNLEDKVSNIEALITKKTNITIDDIEIYDPE